MVENPLQNKEAFINEILEVVNNRLSLNNLSTPPKFLYDWIFEAVSNEYRIIPTNMQVDYAYVNELAQAISQWIFGKDVQPEDVSVESLLQHLSSDGWTIIPPQR